MNDVLKAKATEIGALHIDNIRTEALGGWITGPNSDIMISTDNTHPTNLGHKMYGDNIVASMLGLDLNL